MNIWGRMNYVTAFLDLTSGSCPKKGWGLGVTEIKMGKDLSQNLLFGHSWWNFMPSFNCFWWEAWVICDDVPSTSL